MRDSNPMGWKLLWSALIPNEETEEATNRCVTRMSGYLWTLRLALANKEAL